VNALISVLMVTKYFPPVSYGGTEKYVEVVSRKLSERGLKVTILGPSREKVVSCERDGRVLICRFPINQIKSIDFSIQMRKFIKSLSYDLVHFNTFGMLCRFLRPVIKSPYVITTHGFFWNNSNCTNPIKYLLNVKILKNNFVNANQIFCVSKKDYKSVRNMFGYQSNRLHYLPNGVDIQKFSNKNKDSLKRKYGFKNKIIITQVGRFAPQKGQHVLLNALRIMPKKTKEKYAAILAGYPFDHRYFHRLEKIIKTNKIEKHVTLWPEISDDILSDLYGMTDVFVLPSFVEGLPLTLLEAWASKCAVVVTAVGGLPYVVKNGIDGFIVPPNNPFVLSKRIADLILNDEKMKDFSKRGFERAKNEFNLDDHITFLVEKYQEIVDIGQ
jgi:glycosyltransferase involved in cell wall biosynthesis